MATSIKYINFDDWCEALPSCVVIMVIVFSGNFGIAGYLNSTNDWGSSGGGGYYGGTSINTAGASSGGSSFISGFDKCDAIDYKSTENDIIHTGKPE